MTLAIQVLLWAKTIEQGRDAIRDCLEGGSMSGCWLSDEDTESLLQSWHQLNNALPVDMQSSDHPVYRLPPTSELSLKEPKL